MRWVMAADDACMVRFSGCLVLVALAFNGCGDTAKTGAQTPPELTASAGASPIVAARTATPVAPTVSGAPPVLLGDVEVPAPERDDSPALLAHLEARRRQAMKLLRDAAAAPRSAAGGCVLARPTMAGATPPKAWLPKPPTSVGAVMLGRQVQVDVTLPPAAPSAACRVAGLTIVVFSGRGGTTTFNSIGGIENYSLLGREQLRGRTVRLVGRIPYGGAPPYHLSVNTQTVQGLRSTYDDRTLSCPDGGRCLAGGRPAARPGLPRPLLPTRGITPQSLERSVRQVLAGEPPLWIKVTHASCATTRTCQVDFYDSAARARLRLRYAVEGEQRPGCWLAMVTRSHTVPARASVTSPSAARRLGGCVTWG